MKMGKGFNEASRLSAQERELINFLLEDEGVEIAESQTIAPRREMQEIPLSSSQERLWILEQLLPGTSTYHIPEAFRLKGAVNVDALKRTINEIVRRHEILRTTFASKVGRPIQVVAPELLIELPVLDFSHLPESSRRPKALDWLNERMRQPFDLVKGPLLRADLIRLAEQEHILLLTMHHIVSDGWSTRVFVREIVELYTAFSNGEPSPLPDLPIQFADYCLWEKQWLESEGLQAEYEFWKQQLHDLPVLSLPTDFPRPKVQEFRGAMKLFELPVPLSNALNAFSTKEGVTLFMSLMSAFAALLYRCSGQEDIPIGTPVANRNRPHTEELIGFFVNTLVLRVDLSKAPTYKDLLRRVRETTLNAFDHQELPFDRLVAALQPDRDLSRSALRQVVFAKQNLLNSSVELPGLTIEPVVEETNLGVARLDLALFMWEAEDRLMGALEYNTDLFEPSTIDRFIYYLQVVLEDMVSDPEHSIIELPPLIESGPPTSDREAIASPELRGREYESIYKQSNLTEGQLLFWFSQRFQPEVQLYFDRVIMAFRINLEIEHVHFQSAFQKLIDDSDALRSVIYEVDGVPQRTVLEHLELSLDNVDFSEQSDPPAALDEWLRERYRNNQASDTRLFDSALLKLGQSRFVWYLNVHHIITDMWSQALIVRYMSDYYKLAVEGNLENRRPPSPFQDYVEFERRYRFSDEYSSDESYWNHKLADSPSFNRFYSTDSSAQTSRSRRIPYRLSDEQSSKVREAVSKQGLLSPAIVFSTVLFAYLYRTSGERTHRVGSSYANRTDEFKNIIGLLFNICPQQVAIEAGETFISLARKVQVETIATARHQKYPVRDPLNNRVYNINFTYQNVAFPAFCGVPINVDLIYSGHSKYSLALQVRDFDATGHFILDFDFNYGAFDDQQCQQALQHILRLLDAFMEDGSRPLHQASMLSRDEQHQLLIEFNSNHSESSEDSCWPQLFEAQVARSPKAVAATCEGESLSYEELNRRANRLARTLVSRGVGPDSVVALLAERGIKLLVSMIAVFKAGGAYLPLDPRYPPRRLSQILSQSGAGLIMIEGKLKADADEMLKAMNLASGLQVLEMDAAPEEDHAGENLPPLSTPRNLAYLIYTSGSTGAPKGAMIEHEGMLNHLFAKIDDLEMTDADRIAQTASQSFDISVWQFFSLLLVGGSVHIFPDTVAYDPIRLLHQVEQQRISVLETVPSLLQAMLDQIKLRDSAPPDLSALRWIVPTGEALPPEMCRQWLGYYPGVPLVNAYGPTECSDDVTHYFVSEPPAANVTHMPIGRPIVNLQAYTLDPDLRPVPVGLAGQLYVGGMGICRGYLRDPKLTAEVFIPNPFSSEPGERLYKTGDLARHLPDGNIQFLGRVDHQVKIRGFRIELGEIESLLDQQPSVKEAVVIAREDIPGDKRLVAYLVPAQNAEVPIADLRGLLTDRLPDYMVPSAFVVLDSLPLTPNGKLNREALPVPDQTRSESDGEYVGPRTPVEELLTDLMGQVLGVERVSIHDNFFKLGGYSLLATQYISRIHQALLVDIPLRTIFESPTVAQLAEAISQTTDQLGNEEGELLAELLSDLQQVSDDDLDAMLEEE
jgi:amino acid adenylation domain-containing protein